MYIIAGTKTEDGLLLKNFNYMVYDEGGSRDDIVGDYVLMETLPPDYDGEIDINYVYLPYINLTTMEYEFEVVRKPRTPQEEIEILKDTVDELTIMLLELGGALVG